MAFSMGTVLLAGLCTMLPGAAEALAPPSQNAWVVRIDGSCATFKLYSAPADPPVMNSSIAGDLRAGDGGRILEIDKNPDGRSWYHIRLTDGRQGWITQSCPNVVLQVGGTFPGVRLRLTTASGRKLEGYLRHRTIVEGDREETDLGLVEQDARLFFQDAELGKVSIAWRDIRRLAINSAGALITSVSGEAYKISSRIGVEESTALRQQGFIPGQYSKRRVETTLWFSTKSLDIKLSDLKPGAIFEQQTSSGVEP